MKQINTSAMTTNKEVKILCTTWTYKHLARFDCPGKCTKRYFDSGQLGHIKGASVCRKPKDKKKQLGKAAKDKKPKSNRVKDEFSEEELDDTDDDLSDSCSRVLEIVN